MGTARWTYNRCLEYINASCKIEFNKKLVNEVGKNMKDLRMYVVNSENYLTNTTMNNTSSKTNTTISANLNTFPTNTDTFPTISANLDNSLTSIHTSPKIDTNLSPTSASTFLIIDTTIGANLDNSPTSTNTSPTINANLDIPLTREEYDQLNQYDIENLEWVIKTPYSIRDMAAKDLLNAYKVNFTKLKKQAQQKFFMRFKSKKDRKDSIYIPHRDYKAKKGEFAFLKNIKASEKLPTDLMYDSRLIKTKTNQYYLCIPQPLDMRNESQVPQTTLGVVALDPGIRTFQTTFDLNSVYTEWGKGDSVRLGRLCHAYDKLQSKWTQVNHQKRYKYKKAGRRLMEHIRNLVNELHKKLALWLCHNYQTILLPTFNTSSMARKLHSKTARSMLTWSHYRFQQRLIHKAREFTPTRQVFLVNESYTSKTCTHCGHIHKSLGGHKTFQCPSCGLVLDRDVNGARNILLRFLTKHL